MGEINGFVRIEGDPSPVSERCCEPASDRKIYWRCFHCGEGFTKAQKRWAAEHFGRQLDAEPVCLIRSAGETALLTILRKQEDELAAHRAEDTDLLRALWSVQSDHRQALIREEERGYAKGVADGRRYPADDASQHPSDTREGGHEVPPTEPNPPTPNKEA